MLGTCLKQHKDLDELIKQLSPIDERMRYLKERKSFDDELANIASMVNTDQRPYISAKEILNMIKTWDQFETHVKLDHTKPNIVCPVFLCFFPFPFPSHSFLFSYYFF